MNSELSSKHKIENNLKTFDRHPLRQAATSLLNTLGYYSNRVGREDIDNNRFERIKAKAAESTNPDQRLCYKDWQSFAQIMQVANEEVKQQLEPEQITLFENTEIDTVLRTSYMFDAIRLRGDRYTRTQLANITRFVSMQIPQSFMLIFRYGDVLTLAIINRRESLQDSSKQVLEKVTLIKDIKLESPNRAHIDIISELHLQRLIENEGVKNFDTLHDAWESILNTEPLNRKFYKELYKWYQWAVAECKFPDDDNDMQVIRMVTRLLFIWFLKEKNLVPEDILDIDTAEALLNNFSMESSDYYQAVLQNLFFATLNTPINERTFSSRNPSTHRDPSKYRYRDLLQDPSWFLEHLKQVPFVNGGLFDCLDPFEAISNGKGRVDCFTDNLNARRNLHVPARLFFEEKEGIFHLFSRYKFTVEENTPIEQEVALDPELLGQVFENLLGAYNPETRSTARRATGSYYTPRQIVDYMVDEALIAYFLQKVRPYDGDKEYLKDRLRLDLEDLLAYELKGKKDEVADHLIHEDEIESLIQAIDELKIIDPAVGTGAFPMGILNKIVLILRKLDPQNERWKQRQLEQAEKIDDPESKKRSIDAINEVFSEINRFNNYSRKVYLIQNCIYGVDIQPIAITIARLRFFISLIIEQETNDDRNANYGIRPLPNLETKFVAANTLIGLKELRESDFQLFLENEDIQQVRQEIAELREKHFNANTRKAKRHYMKQEKACRKRLAEVLAEKHKAECKRIQDVVEHLVEQAQLSEEHTRQELREELQQEYAVHEEKLAAGLAEANRIADWDAYDQNAVADFFEPEWMFGVKEGFDIAISNPPYIRHEKIRHLKPALQMYFENFFASTADISVYFYKRAFELLREGGILTYICTNKYMRSGYGKNLRQFLTTDMSLQILLDFGNVPIFEAAVDTCVILGKKCLTAENGILHAATLKKFSGEFHVRKVFQKQAFPILVSRLSSAEWTLADRKTLNLLEKFQNIGVSLGRSRLHFGVKTGYNEAFIIDSEKRERLIAEDVNCNELIKPLLRGRDIRKWRSNWKNLYLIAIASTADTTWSWSEAKSESEAEVIFATTYPAIHHHFARYRERLIDRKSRGKYYWEPQMATGYSLFENPKILYSDISPSMRACYDTSKAFCLQTAYIMPTDDFSLLAILNSQVFDWYARHKFQSLNDPWAGGGLRFFMQYMEKIPIADRTPEQKADLAELVEQILDDPESENVRDLEKQIDDMVYRLYGLSQREIRLIEQTYREIGMEV